MDYRIYRCTVMQYVSVAEIIMNKSSIKLMSSFLLIGNSYTELYYQGDNGCFRAGKCCCGSDQACVLYCKNS